ncbi:MULTISPECIES: DUF2630 family protein [Thermomonosporaceae]|uniref:DUF2630 family protein n=1 Tax=Thermomonosporaceae TaxID=2012 RepID=UPI00255AF2DB|nr:MULTISPECIES: DUF2630 family protein [Thermomonosporaceae]MDL4772660.1 DUF2630 family protein [Actinomadura xylanilytica]
MDDKEILARINEFVGEEQSLRERYRRDELTQGAERRRLEQLEVALDQCWDLLRQRRARMEAGESPDGARVRSAGEVEGYLQ